MDCIEYSMEYLFGPHCSDKTFRHDKEIREIISSKNPQSTTQQTQTTENSESSQWMGPSTATPLDSTPTRPIIGGSKSEPKLITLQEDAPRSAFGALSVTPSPRNPFGPFVSSPIPPQQSLRRKAAEEQLGDDRTKRPRFGIPAPTLSNLAVHEDSNSRLILSDRMNLMYSQEIPDANEELIDAMLSNENIRTNISRIRMVLPEVSIYAARSAFLKCRGGLDEAIAILVAGEVDVPDVRGNKALKTSNSMVNPQPVRADTQSHSKQKEEEKEETENEEGQNPSSSQSSQNTPSSSESHCTETPNTYESGCLYLGLEVENYGTFNDKVDCVVRCKSCSHEFWGKYPDCCTNCNPPMDSEDLSDDELEDLPYHEVQESHTELDEMGLRPRMAYEINSDIRDVYDEETLISLADICEPYLDCGSSAYDSQDDDPKFTEEYETNSFIDDEEPEEDSEEEIASSDDDEVDYKEKFKKLQESHRVLQHNHAATENRHMALKSDFQEFRRDILGSDHDSEGMYGSEDVDEEGVLLVDVTPPDPVVTEVILSDSDEGAPDSLMGELRDKSIKEKMSTADAESDVEGYTMVTPQNNHTMEELEL